LPKPEPEALPEASPEALPDAVPEASADALPEADSLAEPEASPSAENEMSLDATWEKAPEALFEASSVSTEAYCCHARERNKRDAKFVIERNNKGGQKASYRFGTGFYTGLGR
jgi:hypothetical protein